MAQLLIRTSTGVRIQPPVEIVFVDLGLGMDRSGRSEPQVRLSDQSEVAHLRQAGTKDGKDPPAVRSRAAMQKSCKAHR